MDKISPQNYDEEDDEGFNINFGKYIETLVRQWQWIIACALGLGIIAFVYVTIVNHLNPSYRAVALVASTATSSNVNFGSAITSVTDLQLSQANGNIHYDWGPTRLQSFVSQVQNGAIAEQVLVEVGPIFDKKGNRITAAAILGTVKGELIKNTDTTPITLLALRAS